MATYIEGGVVRFYTSTPFTSISGVVIDPDVVTFSYAVQGQTTVTYTFTQPTGDPSGKIIQTAAGTYQIDLDTTGLDGTWAYQWKGSPSSGLDVTATQVVYDGEVLISPAAL